MGVREDFDDAMRSIQHSDTLKQLQFAFAEIDRLTGEHDRMRRELEEAKAERDEIKADLAAAGALLSPSDPHVSLPEAIQDLQAELARMRPGLDAAKDFCDKRCPACWEGCTCRSPGCRLEREVVAYFGRDEVFSIEEEE